MSREIPIANIYYLLCYAWDALEEKDALADVGADESPELLNLFARVLANGTHRLLHRGLDRGYLPRKDEIAGVRGKLLATPTLRRSLLRKGRAMCAWDELEYDTLPNRILKTTLARLAGGTLEKRAQAAVRDVLRWLTPVSIIDLHASHFRRVQLHRNNRIYAFLLHVCELSAARAAFAILFATVCQRFSRSSCSTSTLTNCLLAGRRTLRKSNGQ